jgi:hypothetical protein
MENKPNSQRGGWAIRAAVSFGFVMAVSLALSGAAFADHDPADGPEVTPTLLVFPGGDPAAGCFRLQPAVEDAWTVFADAHMTYYYDSTTKKLTFVMDAGWLMAKVYDKGSTTLNLYDYTSFPDGGIAHDDGLVAPDNASGGPAGLSHADFCPVGPFATPTPTVAPTDTPSPAPTDTPSPAPTDTPAPTATPTAAPTDTPAPTATPTAAPTATPTPTLPITGGTPTPTPTLPDTSGSPTTSATPPDPTGNAFLLLLIGSVAGLMFMFLPRKKRERLS